MRVLAWWISVAVGLSEVPLLCGVCLPTACGGESRNASTEVPDNSIDEDGDGWLASSYGYRLRASHPRVLLTERRLELVVDRMYGPHARDPYKRWFNLIRRKADAGEAIELVSLALIYKATGNAKYLRGIVSRIPEEGAPTLTELYAVDIVFDELDTETKLKIMRRAGADRDVFYYASTTQSQTGRAKWGYHSAYGACVALAYAGVFALSDVSTSPEVAGRRNVYAFDELKYIQAASRELSPEGNFFKVENRIAGDPTHNDALPGSPGGMYDNIGYDQSEESASVRLLAEFYTLTGEPRYREFLHDKHRGAFYQHLSLPHKYRRVDADTYAYKAGAEPHQLVQVWNTRSSMWVTQPNVQTVALLHHLYEDPKIQHYVNHGVQFEQRGHEYDGIYWDLIYREDQAPESPPSENPTAAYFSGPGLVSMREDWSNDACFALLLCGEGISRRYEDSNSFMLHRKTHVIPHAGARIRFHFDNDKHHWYHVRSASKNTIFVYDPDECFDVLPDGTRGPLHSGRPLVDSDNLGGQLFETPIAQKSGVYSTGGAGESTRRFGEDPDGLFERGNITKFEHVAGNYTYSVGDATHSYTKKIEFFDREFLHVRPDAFVIFDRVKSTHAGFKKVWRIHTVDRPLPQGPVVDTGLGMRACADARRTLIETPHTVTCIDCLLPRKNRIVVRGGDTVLCSGRPLRPGEDLTEGHVLETDIPRWLEIFAVGNDVRGSLTIYGDAQEGNATSETIEFSGRTMEEVVSRPTSLTAASLTDKTQHWRPGQWKDFMVKVSTSPTAHVRIAGNNENTLFGDFPSGSAWQYVIYRDLANSYKHWKTIRRITTSDMDVDDLTISVPHYFDTPDAKGNLHSFAPHTDYRHDGYRRTKDLGRYTMDVETAEPRLLDNFLNVITPRDPGEPKPSVELVRSGNKNATGVLIDGVLAVFVNDRGKLAKFDMALQDTTPHRAILVDLEPNTEYYYRVEADRLLVTTGVQQGTSAVSSTMGVLSINLK